MSFEEWFKEETGNSKGMQEIESWCDKAYDNGAQSRQAEIDELQKRINQLEQEKLDQANKLDKIFYGEVK